MTSDSLKTSVRIVGRQNVDEFHAQCALFGKRPHELVAEMVKSCLEAIHDDPELEARVRALVAAARSYQHRDADTGEQLANVVSIDRGRRR
jgi:hypothetical protein